MSCPREYASCLTRVAELALVHRPVPHAVTAVRSHRELAGRIERLLDPRRHLAVWPASVVLAVDALSVSGLVVLLTICPPLVSAVPVNLALPIPPQRPVSPQAPRLLEGQRRVSLPDVVVNARVRTLTSPSEATTATALPATGLSLGSTMPLPATRTRFKAPLPSRTLRVDDTMRLAARRRTDTLGLHTRSTVRVNRPASPWVRLARVGRAVGTGTTDVGQATASAFGTWGPRSHGSSVAVSVRRDALGISQR